ncbi:Putative AC transposase, partial [Linum grandiflorum]
RKRVKTNSLCSELDHYLSEDVNPRAANVSVLDWWRVNTGKYPLLQEVARDLLVVFVTSVASESAFSFGGRLLDPHRSRLHFGTVETLIYTRLWIKDDLMKDVGKDEIEGFDCFVSAMMMEDPSCEGFEKGG